MPKMHCIPYISKLKQLYPDLLLFALCTGLPAGKPRYVMGVGYPLDVVVCSALGADMYDRYGIPVCMVMQMQ